MLPSSAAREDEVRHTDPGVFPPLPQRRPLLGKGRRGWARISAGGRLTEVRSKKQGARGGSKEPEAGSDKPEREQGTGKLGREAELRTRPSLFLLLAPRFLLLFP